MSYSEDLDKLIEDAEDFSLVFPDIVSICHQISHRHNKPFNDVMMDFEAHEWEISHKGYINHE